VLRQCQLAQIWVLRHLLLIWALNQIWVQNQIWAMRVMLQQKFRHPKDVKSVRALNVIVD
jgi:hypothetical protein